jgi:hypothetical protein
MDDDESIEIRDPSNGSPSTRPSTYELLIRQSGKLGAVATKAFSDLRHILHHEITLPPAEQFLNSFPRVSKKKVIKKRGFEEIEELKAMVKKSHQVLASVRTVFPVTLFPNSIVLDRSKITIIERNFFWSAKAVSIQVEDVLNVSNSVGPIFGSLTIASRVMSSVDHFQINYLWRGDAIFLKHIIQGYVIAKHSKIDTSNLSRAEMIETLSELGLDSDT